jgi:hypothetical protein
MTTSSGYTCGLEINPLKDYEWLEFIRYYEMFQDVCEINNLSLQEFAIVFDHWLCSQNILIEYLKERNLRDFLNSLPSILSDPEIQSDFRRIKKWK